MRDSCHKRAGMTGAKDVGDDGGGMLFKGEPLRKEDVLGDEVIFRLGTDSSPWSQNDKATLFFGGLFFCGFPFGGYVNDMPGAEDFGYGPGLSDTSPWSERRLTVEDFS